MVSYLAPNGHYSATPAAFATTGADSAPLHALATPPPPTACTATAPPPTFPTNTYNATNYWVDPIFTTSTAARRPAPRATCRRPPRMGTVTVSWAAPTGGATPTSYTITPYIGSTAQTTTTVTGSPPATSATLSGLTDGTDLHLHRHGHHLGRHRTALDGVRPGDARRRPHRRVRAPCSALRHLPTVDAGDTSAVNLGVRFTVDQSGYITGLRFYKAARQHRYHVGSLWSDTGTLLAQATFTAETASGWQQVTLASPVAVSPGTTYVASYFDPNGHYSVTAGGFSTTATSPPSTAWPPPSKPTDSTPMDRPPPSRPTPTTPPTTGSTPSSTPHPEAGLVAFVLADLQFGGGRVQLRAGPGDPYPGSASAGLCELDVAGLGP